MDIEIVNLAECSARRREVTPAIAARVPVPAGADPVLLQEALEADASHVDGLTINVKPFHLSDIATISAELPTGMNTGRPCLIFSDTGTALAGAVVDVHCQPSKGTGQYSSLQGRRTTRLQWNGRYGFRTS
jgi:hypothetical protein